MKFKIKCTYQDDDTGENAWWEEYEKDEVQDAEQWAKDTIENFNATLRKYEKPRKLLEVVVIDRDAKKEHGWVKTSLTMKSAHWIGGTLYDEYQCQDCGITAKGFGVPPRIKRDPKYRAKVYDRCDTSQEHLEEHGHPKG